MTEPTVVSAVTWPVVMLALIAAVPGFIASIAAVIAAMRAAENTQAVRDVHALVNSQLTLVKDKLEAALKQIAELSGKAQKSEAQAPTLAQAGYKPEGIGPDVPP